MNSQHQIRILLLEDNPADARILYEELNNRDSQAFALTHVTRLEQALKQLSLETYDVILSDLSLPDSQGLQTISKLSAASETIPIVALTGLDSEEFSVQAVRVGAQDYLVKGRIDAQLLTRAIRYAIERTQSKLELRRAYDELEQRVEARTAQLAQVNQVLQQEIAERTQVETALRESQQRLAQQNAYLSALHETALGMLSRLELHSILETIITRACKLMGTQHGYIYLLDPQTLNMQVKIGIGAHSENIGHSVQMGEGIAGQVWQSQKLLVVRDYRTWDGRLRQFDPSIFHASVGVPLISNGQITGVLGLAYVESERNLSDGELNFLQRFAQLASIALDNSTLYTAAQQELVERKRAEAQTQLQLQRLNALRNIEIALTSSLDLRVTLNVFLDQLTTQLNVSASTILRLDPLAQNFSPIATRGLRHSQLLRTPVSLSESVVSRTTSAREIINIPDMRQLRDPSTRMKLLLGEGMVAYHGVPLITKGQLKGVLELYHRTPFEAEADWMEFLEALAAQAAIAIDNTTLFEDLQRSNIELMLAYDNTIEGWSRALDLRDRETEGHTQRVTEMTLRMAQQMGIMGNELTHVRRGALLHDIGKMGIPDSILLKPGPLTPDEWTVMRRHPTYAYELLAPIQYLTPSLHIPYCHHEKWDGSGYPRGLKGEQIPLPARIFAVIDVWDALTSDRPYRKGWDMEKTSTYIREQSGTHFDPHIVDAFFAIRAENGNGSH